MSADREPEAGGRALLGRSPLQAVRRHWLLVVVTTLAATGAATAIARNREPTYRATVQMVFSPPGPEFGVLGFSPTGGDPAREAATNVIRVGSRGVAAAAARELGEPDVEALRRRITVSANPNANVVDVTADEPTPDAARRTAIEYADAFRRQQRALEVGRARSARRVLEERYDDLSSRARRTERGLRLRDQIEQLAVLEEIGTGSPRLLGRPREAFRVDKPWQLVVLGGLLGLVLGVGLAFLRAASDRRVRDDDELAASPVPVLATIPRGRALRRDATFAQLPPEAAEAFRRLYARLRFSPRTPRVVVVTSARGGEGKTTVAANLAAGAASSGDAVLLIEADLRHPNVAARLRLSPEGGLIQILEDGADGEYADERGLPTDLPSRNGAGHFDVLDSGGATHRAAALLKSPRMHRLLADARDEYDFVVIDTPPMGQVADAIPLISLADGVLLCTRIGRSNRDETLRVAAELEDMGATVLGLVVNGGDSGGAPYRAVAVPGAARPR